MKLLTHSLDGKLAILDTSRPMGAPQRIVLPVFAGAEAVLAGERRFDLVFIESDGGIAIAFYEEKETP